MENKLWLRAVKRFRTMRGRIIRTPIKQQKTTKKKGGRMAAPKKQESGTKCFCSNFLPPKNGGPMKSRTRRFIRI